MCSGCTFSDPLLTGASTKESGRPAKKEWFDRNKRSSETPWPITSRRAAARGKTVVGRLTEERAYLSKRGKPSLLGLTLSGTV